MDFGELQALLYKLLIQGGSWLTILRGLWATVRISSFSIFFGTLLGAGVCALRMSHIKPIRWLAAIYIAGARVGPPQDLEHLIHKNAPAVVAGLEPLVEFGLVRGLQPHKTIFKVIAGECFIAEQRHFPSPVHVPCEFSP